MRIAQIAPVTESVPPTTYGGTERVVYTLTEELVRRGHEVTLFASGDSKTTAKLVSVVSENLRQALPDDFFRRSMWTLANIGEAYMHQDDFDIIHDHNGIFSMPSAVIAKKPVVMTLHRAFRDDNTPLYSMLANRTNPHLVSISYAQRAVLPYLNYVDNIYHGLPMEHYPFSDLPENYLLFVGRITKVKGVHTAIEVAKRLDLPLILAAKVDRVDQEYFENEVKPHLSDKIRWIGEVNEEERNKLMSKALCFLHPVTWREPFGLTLIESMACGCPVVAFGEGSIPEVIADGKTGFVVKTVNEMVAAVKNIHSINRLYTREYALKNFSNEKMTDGYEQLYESLIAENKAETIFKQPYMYDFN